ncbi:hypothetical protein LWI29_005572 [Acer saccharum]|uniref:Uncharacterized protein n=1 Tax=Acer saccharum TaxID=4024 RepID=A0AA39VR00_ACESA|nr:hypothetical protein LWI29_005572 [Acer saccharum]
MKTLSLWGTGRFDRCLWTGNQLNNQDRKTEEKAKHKGKQQAEGSSSTIAPVERIAEMLARICLKLRSIKDMIEADRGISIYTQIILSLWLQKTILDRDSSL